MSGDIERKDMVNRSKKDIFQRVGIYVLGIFLVSLGIVLCKKCGLGISPISSIPFVLDKITPVTFGDLTMFFHFGNIALQMFLARNIRNPKLWMQVPLAFVFGWVIDWMDQRLVIDNAVLLFQLIVLVMSIVFTALGMVCMIDMNLIQNPPDGTVQKISILLKKELGTVKTVYDIICVVISGALGLLFLHEISGFGIATIASAIFVGKTIGKIREIKKKLKKEETP